MHRVCLPDNTRDRAKALPLDGTPPQQHDIVEIAARFEHFIEAVQSRGRTYALGYRKHRQMQFRHRLSS
jgi:hypothetical protein